MADSSKPRKPPKGGRKGGTIFPKINLQRALQYGKKLVAKTHVGPQPEDEILPGVFGTSGPDGKVRASALKQFGLMQGDAKAYEASQLAKDIDASLAEERPALLQKAVLASKVFDKIFDTFHGDTVSKAQVAKRARESGVHPDSADECAQLFIDSAVTAALGTLSGENISLINARSRAATTEPAIMQDAEQLDGQKEETEEQDSEAAEREQEMGAKGSLVAQSPSELTARQSAVTVNLAVDSSSDPDKLEKQLKLLKEYGLLR
jgi:hypothetical protein